MFLFTPAISLITEYNDGETSSCKIKRVRRFLTELLPRTPPQNGTGMPRDIGIIHLACKHCLPISPMEHQYGETFPWKQWEMAGIHYSKDIVTTYILYIFSVTKLIRGTWTRFLKISPIGHCLKEAFRGQREWACRTKLDEFLSKWEYISSCVFVSADQKRQGRVSGSADGMGKGSRMSVHRRELSGGGSD